ncbi:MAG: hypothetical protein KatS3mg111_3307 [Pirellulaceae bacterium]|nr:MAG: hypothetical protein KatS3mg111_3307 [Pirellulaceae bacterium]
MHRCLISFGANLGDPERTIRLAAERLEQNLCPASGADWKLSRLYHTPAIGGPSGQPMFLNAVAAVHTPADPRLVWQVIRQVEKDLGRTRTSRWEARNIDLDILLFEDCRVWTPELKIPHPRMGMRRFILIPAMEVAATWRDPVTQMTVAELATNLVRQPLGIAVYTNAAHRADAQAILEQLEESGVAERRREDATSTGPWVRLFATPEEAADLAPHLHVWLCFPQDADGKVAWEEQHREVAQRWGIAPGEPPSDAWSKKLRGPRYLLPASDPGWAVHELHAALQAMACSVEPVG